MTYIKEKEKVMIEKIKTTIEDDVKHGRGGWTEIERDPMFITYVRKTNEGEELVNIATEYTATEACTPKIKEGELVFFSLEDKYSKECNYMYIYENPNFYQA